MRFQIIDTYEQIKCLKEQSIPFSLEIYKKYTDSISPSLYQKCLSDSLEYNYQTDVLPVLINALYQHFDRVESAHHALQEISLFLPEHIQNLFQVDLEVTVIFYLGLCNGAGWATTLDGKPVILLGAEKIAELEWHKHNAMCDLVCHETAHQIHYALRKEMSNPCQSVRQLYFEGFATRVSQMLYRENFYHQNQNGWLSFCRDNIDSIKQAYWEKILNQESTSCFFGDWHTFMGYSNLGYYLGCEWMRKMERKYTIQEIAGLTDRIIETEARAFLNNQE